MSVVMWRVTSDNVHVALGIQRNVSCHVTVERICQLSCDIGESHVSGHVTYGRVMSDNGHVALGIQLPNVT